MRSTATARPHRERQAHGAFIAGRKRSLHRARTRRDVAHRIHSDRKECLHHQPDDTPEQDTRHPFEQRHFAVELGFQLIESGL